MSTHTVTINYLKAIVAGLSITAVTLMAGLGVLSGESATLMIGTVVGYVLGNGVQAARHQADPPGIIMTTRRDRRTGDLPAPAVDD